MMVLVGLQFLMVREGESSPVCAWQKGGGRESNLYVQSTLLITAPDTGQSAYSGNFDQNKMYNLCSKILWYNQHSAYIGIFGWS